jgi:hypothetical protein
MMMQVKIFVLKERGSGLNVSSEAKRREQKIDAHITFFTNKKKPQKKFHLLRSIQ